MTTPATNPTFTINMDEIARIVTDVHHVPSYVEQTGGNTATIYAGPTHKDHAGDDRYAACAGPGSYSWDKSEGPSLGEITEFSVGPDDEGEAGYVDMADVGAITEADIAKVIAAQAAKTPVSVLLTPAEITALGLDGSAKSTPEWIAASRRESQAWCTAHNDALRGAYAMGATPAQAVAAATEAMKNWTGSPA